MEFNENLFKGVVSLEYDDDGYIMPLRFTKKQFDRYAGIERCPYHHAPAGVELDFFTDASEISFSYRVGTVWKWWKNAYPCFDIYENGELAEFVNIDINGGELHYSARTDGRKRITVYFPCNAELSIKPLDFGNAKPTLPGKRKFLILGDSISQGLMGNSASFSYTCQIKRFFDADMLNLSVGGDLYDVTALDTDNGFVPTDVIVALGTNDVFFLKEHELITENMHVYLDEIAKLYSYADITVISPPWLTDFDSTSSVQYNEIRRFSAEIEKKVSELGFRYICGNTLVPHNARFFSDNAHPNDLGFSQYAINLIKRLSK